jgi:tRNA nucleotidyltransferase (CCA-adding enzyme)
MKRIVFMLGDSARISTAVLERVTPSVSERKKIVNLSQKLAEQVAMTAKKLKVKAKVSVEGSVAKDTWLSKEPDIDIFMRLPRSTPRDSLGEVCLRVAREATTGSKQVERFADHPYLEAFVEGIRVNIVPCYEAKQGTWMSATDRTPFHTAYVNEHLTDEARSEVRLLKKFMKGVGVYGAEIKIGGFSGYLCELLILHFESFLETMKAFALSNQRIVIDIAGFYDGRQGELNLLFDEPLVVVDPVDKARNVASAVRLRKLQDVVAAGQQFLMRPSLNFFYPPQTVALTVRNMRGELKTRGSDIIFVVFGRVDAVADVLWGQLYKSQRSLRKLVELNDFKVLRDFSWSNEKGLNMFVFELEDCCVPQVKKHAGPPLSKEKECGKFIAKYLESPEAVCGPYVEDGRWTVLVRRKFTDACSLLKERLKDGGRKAGVAEEISHVLKKDFGVFVNEEIADVYERNGEFAVFLTEFLLGRPKWLEAQRV